MTELPEPHGESVKLGIYHGGLCAHPMRVDWLEEPPNLTLWYIDAMPRKISVCFLGSLDLIISYRIQCKNTDDHQKRWGPSRFTISKELNFRKVATIFFEIWAVEIHHCCWPCIHLVTTHYHSTECTTPLTRCSAIWDQLPDTSYRVPPKCVTICVQVQANRVWKIVVKKTCILQTC